MELSQCAYKAKAGILQNETVWANAAKMLPEAWYEMLVKLWHPELAVVRMRVLPQVISASSCERNWSADGHIHSKFCNKLGPETNEKLVFVYSKSKMAATVREADELKMFAWDNEDVQPSLVPCQARPCQPDTLLSLRITESLNRRIVEARILPNLRIARRVRTIGAIQPTLAVTNL